MDELIFEPAESSIEAVGRATKPNLRGSIRSEPLGFPFLGLVLFMIVYFARPEDWIPGLAAVPLAKITGILIFVALGFSLGTIRWHVPRAVVFLALLVVQLWLTVPFSFWRGGAFNVMLDFSKVLPLVAVIYATVRSIQRLRWILLVQAVSVATIAFVSIIDVHLMGGRLGSVLSGIYRNPNDLALIIDVTLPLGLALAITTRNIWKKLAWTVAMLGMTYAVILTASRGGAIAFAVAATICLWQLGMKGRRFYLLFLVPTAAVAFWLYAGSTLEQRFQQTDVALATNKQVTEAFGSAEQRKELLIESLRVTAQHPFFGVGPGNFENVSGFWRVTHNSYTQVSSEGGIPAFLLYALIFWTGIATLRKVRRQTRNRTRIFSMALEASLVAYLVGSFFLSLAYYLFPYCLVAYTSALAIIAARDRKLSTSEGHSIENVRPIEPAVEHAS
jgi:O-antigen ligase